LWKQVVGAEQTDLFGYSATHALSAVLSAHSNKVSKKYMPLYVAEFQFQYNNRANAHVFGEAISGV
jgi:hypothetical protein